MHSPILLAFRALTGSEDLAAYLEHALVRLMPAASDCFTYALADRTGYPVRCTGDDSVATGISVPRPPTANRETVV
jgi:uncharacterized protein with PIN domain